MAQAPVAATKEKPNVVAVDKKLLDEIHDALKPISERSAHYDVRQLATVMLRLIEGMRGDKEQIPVPARHHP